MHDPVHWTLQYAVKPAAAKTMRNVDLRSATVPANESKGKKTSTLKDKPSLYLCVNETARLTENFGVVFFFFNFFFS